MAADERIITELIIQGAEQSVRQIESVATATTGLVVVQENAGVRQREVYDSVARAAEQAAQAEQTAALRAQETIQRTEEATTRTIVAEAAKRAEARRSEAAAVVAPVVQQAQRAASFPTQNNLTAPRLQVAVDAAQFTAARNAIIAEQAAAQTLQGRLTALATAIQQVIKENLGLSQSSQEAATNLNKQSSAANSTQSSGISYLSVLSAIHAASFLATNQTFSLIGSFTTLGLAFGKAGVAAGAAGLALGGILAVFGQIQQASQLIQQATISTAETFLKLGVAGTVALAGLGAAGVKSAADVETQLAGVRAFGGATADQLQKVQQQANQFAIEFGTSAASVVKATSLFAQAGGTIAEAIGGATEAIVRFQLASQGAGQQEVSLEQAAIAVSAGLKLFGLAGDQAIRVVDNLTAASQASALSFTGVTQAFIQAAPGAVALGITIEDLSTAIALIGDQLIKGTITGTAFKQFIIDLVKPSKQAADTLAQYGIAIQDTNKNILPLQDILHNLNVALGDQAVASGKVGTAERERALAQIFGSRAFLAANILTRAGSEGLEAYRTKLEALSTNNIVDVLLLPLNKQLEILSTTVQVAGQAFGGPLLQPIRAATVAAIEFFKQTIPFAELLGQAISVVVSGQGFGALAEQISTLVGNTALATFLIELVNSFRNVRDVIVSDILPAINDFIGNIGLVASESGRLTDAVNFFKNLNNAIQVVGVVAAIAIRSFSELVTQIIHNEGAGKTLRDTLVTLADAIVNRLVASLTVTLASLGAAIALMPTFAKASIVAAQVLIALGKGFLVFNDILINTASQIALVATTFDALIQAELGNRDAVLNLGNSLGAVITRTNEMHDANQKALSGLAETGKVVDDLANGGLDKLIAAAKETGDSLATGAKEGIKSFENQLGEIPNIISNITAETEQRTRALQDAQKPGGTPAQFVDEKALKSQVDKIDAAGRDLSVRLSNLAEDASQKVTNTVESALARVTDIFDKAQQQLDDLQVSLELRIKEINERLAERQADRAVLDPFKKQQEDRLTEFTRGLDKEDQAQERSLDHQRTQRQRDNEDVARSVNQAAEDVATGFQRQQQSAEIAFQAIQQARTTAFERGQQVEATAFERAQQAAADARDFAKQLATAKPADQANLIQQHNQALQDTRFRQGQENDLTKFRQNQEDKKLDFTKANEASALSFRQTQETQLTDFRRREELKILDFRRNAENKETGIREGEEDAALARRLAREDVLTARRRSDAEALQAFQDQLDRNKADAQIQDAIDKAHITENKIIRDAGEKAAAVLESVNLTFDKETAALEAQIRNVQETLDRLKDSVPPELLASVQARLTAVQNNLDAAKAQTRATVAQAQDAARLQTEQAIAVGNAGLLTRPSVTAGLGVPESAIPFGVVTAQTMQVTNLVLPNGFSNAVSAAVLLGIQQASDQGFIPTQVIPPDVKPIQDDLSSIRKFLT